MIRVFRDHRLDYYAVAGQPLLDDARRQGRHGHRTCLAAAADPLFPLNYPYKIPRRLDIQLFTLVVTDHRCCCAALAARLLRAMNYFLDALQVFGQPLPAWMRAALAWGSVREWSAPRFRLHLVPSGARLFVC